MPNDWQRSLVTLTATVVTVVVVAVLYWARSVFIPIALSIFLAFVLGPVVARLQRRGLGRVPSVVLTVGLVLVLTAGIGTLIGVQVGSLTEDLKDEETKRRITAKVTAVREWLAGDDRLGKLWDEVSEAISPKPRAADGQTTYVVQQQQPGLFSSQLAGVISPAAEVLGQAAFAFILTVFFLIKKEDLRNRMIRLLGDGKVTTTTRAVDDASTRVSRYLFMQFLINSGFGLVIALGLFLLGVKYALLWGLVAAVMRYVPYVGTVVGVLPVVVYSFATADGWGQPLGVLALFVGLEATCNNVFEPWLYGRSMGVSEVAQLVSAGFWAFLWGPIGLILSGPLTTCLLVLGRHVRRFSFLEVMLGDQPALAPPVAFYQRLAARDQDEAADVALARAKESGPEAALDEVVVPALCIARRDLDEGDLAADDFRFAVRAAREVVTELADLRPIPAATAEDRVRVLVVPARDEAEHVAADALAATLDASRWEVRVAGDEMLASELAATVQEFDPAVVVLAALPPGGLSHCRYLVSRLQARCPGVHVLVGRWGTDDEGKPNEPAEGIKGADGTDRTPAETRKRLAEMHPVFVTERARDGQAAGGKRVPVGTAGA
jgi:predicted PurR-regulated permease PerM